MSQPILPEHVVIDLDKSGKAALLTIDGQPFPYLIAEDGIAVDIENGVMPRVTVTMLVDRVEILPMQGVSAPQPT